MGAEQPVILPMRGTDLDAVQRVATSGGGLSWPRRELEAELARPYSVARVLRAAPGEPLAAFLICWVTGAEAQLLHLATAAAMRRRGYGRALLGDAFAVTRSRGARDMILEVRVTNAPALALYTGEGFERIGLRQRYYSDTGEDAVVMKCALG